MTPPPRSFLLLVACSLQLFQVLALDPTPAPAPAPSMILQDSIVQAINSNPSAAWKAAANPYFANHTVAQFKHMLGAKRSPQNALYQVVSHPKDLNLPQQFDARTAWPQCSTIANILGSLA